MSDSCDKCGKEGIALAVSERSIHELITEGNPQHYHSANIESIQYTCTCGHKWRITKTDHSCWCGWPFIN